MRNTFKKISALVIAAVMMLSLGAIAFAADNDGSLVGDGIAGNTDGVWATQDTPVVQSAAKVSILKELKAYNPDDDTTISAPTISYPYTVTAGAAGKDIYDNEDNHATGASAHVLTKAGILIGLKINNVAGTTGTISWSPAETITASSAGYKNTKSLEIDFSEVAFNGAGVYRYVITEGTPTSYVSSGVVDGTITAVRYLDVYVKEVQPVTNPVTYEIYGFVCFCNDNSIDGRDTPALDTPADAVKTEGFVAGTNGTADSYYTYNLTIAKTLVGDNLMNSHQFPFSLDFVNATVTDDVLPLVTNSGTSTMPTLAAGDINGMDQDGTNLKIANGGSVTFTGIPVGTTVTINEKNDVTGTVYTAYTTGGTTNNAQANAKAINPDEWTSAVTGWTTVTALQTTADDIETAATENMTVTFTNTLLTISPTGVVMRVAPFAAILGAGVLLFAVSRRYTKKNGEEVGEAVEA